MRLPVVSVTEQEFVDEEFLNFYLFEIFTFIILLFFVYAVVKSFNGVQLKTI